VNDIAIKEFDVLHMKYSMLREAHVNGLISDQKYITKFGLIINDILELIEHHASSCYNFHMQPNDVSNLNMQHYYLAIQRYEYLVRNYNIIKAIYDQTVAAYGQETKPEADL
jgi:hypothetical protein